MTKVYDLATRLFHWLFAALFVFSFSIAEFIDDESIIFTYHMLAGMIMLVLVVWRLGWGLAGPETAKLSDWLSSPRALVAYGLGVFRKDSPKFAGHNPASGGAAMAMLGLALALGASGVCMKTDVGGDIMEEVHELSAKLFLIIALAHIAGVVLHHLIHRDGMLTAMLSGYKKGVPLKMPLATNGHRAALILAILVLGSSAYLVSQYDTKTRILSLPGAKLSLDQGYERPGDTAEDDD